ncbi:PREDICTED: glycosyltransferase 8 domain-containing protein 2 isoform X5 [Chinchilla lanigera]|uniref:glycosyltransferase 8 domain-containing protein 2 isoform X5 n=1 Tax=Chinchilla lanigera TaxID=34839 RepID=UPI0006978BD8|nr:PREDICTED: glycosyltransferase 8 domain-containing protein 2 isoform X5 [Chinchilla lanigera]
MPTSCSMWSDSGTLCLEYGRALGIFELSALLISPSFLWKWIEHSKLREINFKIVEFNPTVLEGKIRPDASRPELLQPLNFVRFYLPLLIHQHEKVIYLDDDVIVQGDIQELYDTTLALGHAAAFSGDCDLPAAQDLSRLVGLQNTYMGYLDYRKKSIKDLGISPSTCSFNPGVIVANMTEWRHQRITKQLEKWMQRNVQYAPAACGPFLCRLGLTDTSTARGKPVQQLPGRRRGYLTHAHRVPREILHHQPPVAHPAPGLESRRQVLGAFPAGSEATALGRAAQALAFPQRPCRLVGKLVRARPCGDIQTQSQQLTEPAAGTVCFSFVLFFFWYQESNSRPCTCQAGAVPLS